MSETNVIQFESVKKGVSWFWNQRARRFGRAQNVDTSGVRTTPEEREQSNKTYAAMVECLAEKDPRGGDDLHEALGRAAVVSVVGRGQDQQGEADRQYDQNPEKARDVVEWSKAYAGRGLGIVTRRMRERGLLAAEEATQGEGA